MSDSMIKCLDFLVRSSLPINCNIETWKNFLDKASKEMEPLNGVVKSIFWHFSTSLRSLMHFGIRSKQFWK